MNGLLPDPSGELAAASSLADRFGEAMRRSVSGTEPFVTAVVDEARATAASTPPVGASAWDLARTARIATARAIVAAHEQDRSADAAAAVHGRPVRGGVAAVADAAAQVRGLPRAVAREVGHIVLDRPHSILLRLVITLGVSLGLVAFYEFSGWSNYTAAQLMLYLYSALVGSTVCTNALCFEADRTRALMLAGQPPWRILLVRNIAVAILMVVTGLPVIALLVFGPSEFSVVAVVDQFLVMVFVWLGIANILSVVSPLRREPVSARLHDGTWLPYLLSFAVSYGVGLTVNLMIYWRLWARHAASDEITGGAVAAFVLVLVSSMLSWALLTVTAAACLQNRHLRRAVDREMIVYAG